MYGKVKHIIRKHVWEDKTPLESMYGKIKHTIRKHVWEDKTHH